MRELEPGVPSAWLASFSGRKAPPGQPGRQLDLLAAPPGWSPQVSESPNCRVILDGGLYEPDELREQLGEDIPSATTDADLVAQAYRRWGEEAVSRLKGIFALIIADRTRDLLLCARDPLGIRPLFYTEVNSALLLSPSIETLLAHEGVSKELNRACLVDYLTKQWPANDETYFTDVRRVPPGHVMRVSAHDRRVYRYWNPVPAGRPLEWIADDEAQEHFEKLLARAVARCLLPGRPGVYISGGLDSSTLAMVATDLGCTHGGSVPFALSLVFPETGREEAERQRSLAAVLGLPQVQLAYEDAVGPAGTLATALDMARSLPAPLMVLWRPALRHLALEGRERGCRVILDGDGADEWLWVNPIIAADMIKALDLPGLYRLWQTYARSYHFSSSHAFRIVMWRCGANRLLLDAYYAAAAGLGARRVARQRWRSDAVKTATVLPWVAPDPELRAQIVDRLEASYVRDEVASRSDSYYLHDTRSRLDSAGKWFREEETFLIGQRLGVPIREPFWDPDLIEFLVRVRPRARTDGGRAKALVRRPLTKRFPHLEFDRQRKSWLGPAGGSVLKAQTGAAREAMGGLPTLVNLGVIDREQARVFHDDALAATVHPLRVGWAWELLNLEAWARAHS